MRSEQKTHLRYVHPQQLVATGSSRQIEKQRDGAGFVAEHNLKDQHQQTGFAKYCLFDVINSRLALA